MCFKVQGVREHFEFKCVKMGNWVSSKNYFAAFSEGWATYVEKHVADVDMKLYENDIMGKYGMLKHQVWQNERYVAISSCREYKTKSLYNIHRTQKMVAW